MPQFRVERTAPNPASAWLRAFRYDVTSQCGEDGVIEKLLEVLGVTNRYCVEFGAWDGKRFSNTYNLLANRGWSGLLIECDPAKFAELERTYAGRSDIRLLNTFVDLGANRLDRLLSAAGAPPTPDLVSIDVDGMNWFVWESLLVYRPRAVVIEFNPAISNDVFFVQDRDFHVHQGCSLGALVTIGRQKGYELAATTDWNAFFVERGEFPKLGISDNSLEALHDDRRYESKFFQFYDGTLMVAGCTHLLWRSTPATVEDIRQLSA